MIQTYPMRSGLLMSLCLLLLASGVSGWAATNGAVKAAATAAHKNDAAVPAKTTKALPEIPKSTFTYNLAARGKDPFNPSLGKTPDPATNAPVAAATLASNSPLSLKGIILGVNRRRLAVINNGVFAVGDTSEVLVATGKASVHCLEIGEGFAVVTMAGSSERQMLRMRKD